MNCLSMVAQEWLEQLFSSGWREETLPRQWREGLIVGKVIGRILIIKDISLYLAL